MVQAFSNTGGRDMEAMVLVREPMAAPITLCFIHAKRIPKELKQFYEKYPFSNYILWLLDGFFVIINKV